MSLKSELLSRHPEIFEGRSILVTGFFPDNEIISLARTAENLLVWCTDYVQFLSFAPLFSSAAASSPAAPSQPPVSAASSSDSSPSSAGFLSWQEGNKTVMFGAEPAVSFAPSCALIYMSKNKKENIFYLESVRRRLPEGSEVFVIGGNDEGVRGMETILKNTGPAEKYDYGRKCALFRMIVKKSPALKTEAAPAAAPSEDTTSPAPHAECYNAVIRDISLNVAMIPGVFSMDRMDQGTRFLLESIADLDLSHVKTVLDAGTGSGIIAVFLKKLLPDARVTAVDVSAFALKAARETARLNNADIRVLPSDMLDETDRYDLIISNPPFHVGKKQVFGPVLKLIRDCPSHLNSGGSFFMVANAFLPYENHLSQAFWKSGVKNRNSQYKILYGFTK